jgi:hypothetical protein
MRRLRDKDVVTLQVAELDELTAVVEVVSENNEAVLALVKPAAEPLPDIAASGNVVLRHESPLGIFEARGSVTPQAPGGRKLRFDPADEPAVIQRREHARVEADLPVVITPVGAGHDRIGAHTVNVSGGGVLLEGAAELDMGDRVRVALMLDDGGGPLETVALVVRELEGGRIGLLFDLIDEPARERLIHYVFDRERENRRIARDGPG